MLQLRLVASSNAHIKFIPQIKEMCAKCGAYVRFAPQTPERIKLINEALGYRQ